MIGFASIKQRLNCFWRTKEEPLKVSAQLQSVMLKTTNRARNLGVFMDSDNYKVSLLPSRVYQELKDLFPSRFWKNVFVHLYSVDLTPVVFTGLRQLQLIQDTAAQVFTKTKKADQKLHFSSLYTGVLSVKE